MYVRLARQEENTLAAEPSPIRISSLEQLEEIAKLVKEDEAIFFRQEGAVYVEFTPSEVLLAIREGIEIRPTEK
jgi:hypothetical protein